MDIGSFSIDAGGVNLLPLLETLCSIFLIPSSMNSRKVLYCGIKTDGSASSVPDEISSFILSAIFIRMSMKFRISTRSASEYSLENLSLADLSFKSIIAGLSCCLKDFIAVSA